MSSERPLEYWMALAQMGFEDDLHRLMSEQEVSRTDLARATDTKVQYISRILSSSPENFTIRTMVKLARALGALLQIRLVRDGKEVVRVMDVDSARAFDDNSEGRSMITRGDVSVFKMENDKQRARILPFPVSTAAGATASQPPAQAADNG